MFSNYKIIELNDENDLRSYNQDLKLFEGAMSQSYPLGNDSFRICHGDNYFDFFRRLGEINYFIINNKQTKMVVGTACCILRTIDEKLFWYACDLKIDKNHRGNNLALKLFLNFFMKFFKTTTSGYLVSMDPGSKQIVYIFNNIQKSLPVNALNIKIGPTLYIYALPLNTMILIEKYLTAKFGCVTYLSLVGTKDLILDSTKQSMNLYHLQHGPFAAKTGTKNLNELSDAPTIMFSLPETSPLIKILAEHNIKTNITATIISHQMDFFDWHWILTSDI